MFEGGGAPARHGKRPGAPGVQSHQHHQQSVCLQLMPAGNKRHHATQPIVSDPVQTYQPSLSYNMTTQVCRHTRSARLHVHRIQGDCIARAAVDCIGHHRCGSQPCTLFTYLAATPGFLKVVQELDSDSGPRADSCNCTIQEKYMSTAVKTLQQQGWSAHIMNSYSMAMRVHHTQRQTRDATQLATLTPGVFPAASPITNPCHPPPSLTPFWSCLAATAPAQSCG